MRKEYSCQTAGTEIPAEIRPRRNGSEGVSPQVGIQIAGKRLVGNNRDADPRFDKQVDAELLSGAYLIKLILIFEPEENMVR